MEGLVTQQLTEQSFFSVSLTVTLTAPRMVGPHKWNGSQGFTKATTAALFLVLCICLDKRINGSASTPARTAATRGATIKAAAKMRARGSPISHHQFGQRVTA